MEFAKVELKYEKGKMLTVRTGWILNFKSKFNRTDDFLCYWSNDINQVIPNLECGYSKQFMGTPSLFKVFIVKIGGSIDELENTREGKRLKTVAKRFRQDGNTDSELKQLEAKKRRSEKKQSKKLKAKADEVNSMYLIDNLEQDAAKNDAENPDTEDVLIENELTDVPFNKMTSTAYEQLVKGVVGDSDIECLLNIEMEYEKPDEEENVSIDPADPPLAPFDVLTYTDLDEIAGVTNESVINSILIPNAGEEAENLDIETVSIENDLTDVPHESFDLLACSAYVGLAQGAMDGSTIDSLLVSNTEAQSTEIEESEILTNDSEAEHYNTIEPLTCYKLSDETIEPKNDGNIMLFNYDEVAKKNKELTLHSNELLVTVNEQKAIINNLKSEVETLQLENSSLKQEVEKGTKRNAMLQDYLVAANQTIPEDLYEEKDGGRVYKGGVFLNKNQCLVLEKSNSDREFLNNLTTAIFGREVLKTHSISGTPSNNTKGPAKNKLNPDLIALIYEIMDARSFANSTKKLTKSEKNAIIGKKCSNVASYKSLAKSMSAVSSVSESQDR